MYDITRKANKERRLKVAQYTKPLYGYKCIHYNKYFCFDPYNRPCNICEDKKIWDSFR